ncbi:MAG: hypothetical protein Q4D98_07220 [Planctomycetia bacterium]|nr:hypothetical protein [Planctomycetia bacterium]
MGSFLKWFMAISWSVWLIGVFFFTAVGMGLWVVVIFQLCRGTLPTLEEVYTAFAGFCYIHAFFRPKALWEGLFGSVWATLFAGEIILPEIQKMSEMSLASCPIVLMLFFYASLFSFVRIWILLRMKYIFGMKLPQIAAWPLNLRHHKVEQPDTEVTFFVKNLNVSSMSGGRWLGLIGFYGSAILLSGFVYFFLKS